MCLPGHAPVRGLFTSVGREVPRHRGLRDRFHLQGWRMRGGCPVRGAPAILQQQWNRFQQFRNPSLEFQRLGCQHRGIPCAQQHLGVMGPVILNHRRGVLILQFGDVNGLQQRVHQPGLIHHQPWCHKQRGTQFKPIVHDQRFLLAGLFRTRVRTGPRLRYLVRPLQRHLHARGLLRARQWIGRPVRVEEHRNGVQHARRLSGRNVAPRGVLPPFTPG